MIRQSIYQVFLSSDSPASYGAVFAVRPTPRDLLDAVADAKALLREAAVDPDSDETDKEAASIHFEKLDLVEQLAGVIRHQHIEDAINHPSDGSPVVVAGVRIGLITIETIEVLFRDDFKIILPVVTELHAGYPRRSPNVKSPEAVAEPRSVASILIAPVEDGRDGVDAFGGSDF